ncbi:MAG: sugar ABC transporter permease [Spirochaetia bacterium]|nr:sugar ABC transporter permease [Spirochaetia bacterium]
MSLEKTSLSGATSFVGLLNYSQLFHEGNRFFTNLKISLIYVLSNICLTIPMAYATALLITKDSGLSRFFRSLYLIPWISAPVVSTLMVRSMLDPDMGLIHLIVKFFAGHDVYILNNGRYALIVMILHSFWRSFPFIMLFLAAGMSTIPNEFYEAAKIDGAGKVKSFFYLTLPLTANQLCIGVLMVTIWTLQDSESVYALTKGGPGYSTETLAVRLFKSSFVNFDLNIGAAIGMILILISLVFMSLYLKVLLKESIYE